MGFDVYGKKPSNETGKYFRNNCWYWRPLWNYVETVCPKIAAKVEYPQSNDGSGLDEEDAFQLYWELQQSIQNGTLVEYEKAYKEYIEQLPDEKCSCVGDDNIAKNECFACKGTGMTQNFDKHYPFDSDNVREFAEFVKYSGGFEIW